MGVYLLGYHAHVYFDSGTQPQAESLRRLLIRQAFPLDFIGKIQKKPHGPHPMGTFEIHFEVPIWGEIIEFFEKNRGGLSVLIHEKSGDDPRDHQEGALWLGRPLSLDFSRLDPPKGQALLQKNRLLT